MADSKDPLRHLRDLAQLKDHLEDIQRRVDGQINAGIPQGSTVLSSSFLKGLLAGYIFAKVRSSVIFGLALGTCMGVYTAQTYKVPNVEKTIRDFFSSMKKGPK